MNNLLGTWILPDFLNGKIDSGKFLKFLEDMTYIFNDGNDQAESIYKIEGDNELILEPVLGLSPEPLRYKFSVQNTKITQFLSLNLIDTGISYTLVKKAD